MFRFSLILFILFSVNLHATQVTIRGQSNAPHQIVRLIVCKDLISNFDQTLATAQSDETGNFILNVDIQYITAVQMALGLDRVDIFLSPGATYQYKLNRSETGLTTSYFEKEPLGLTVLKSSDGGLQQQISDINLVFNAFVIQHFDDLYRNKRTSLLDTLRLAIANRLPSKPVSFVSEYNTYKQASLLQTVRGRSADQWIQTLFIQKPVLYTNPAYMNLLNEVFRDYLSINRAYQIDDLNRSIQVGYEAFMQYISLNPILKMSPQISELVGLMNLRDLYFNASCNREAIIQLLNQFRMKSQNPTHRDIAANIIQSVSYLAYKTDAPTFTLKNKASESIALNDFHEKEILLNFVQDSSAACLRGLLEMKLLYEKFKDDYVFITISTNEGFGNYIEYFKKNDLKWSLLNLSTDILLAEAYRVKTFPEYFILLKESKIGMAPAPQPEENLAFHLGRLRGK